MLSVAFFGALSVSVLRYISLWLTNDAFDKEVPMEKSVWNPVLLAASFVETAWVLIASLLAPTLLAFTNST